MARYKTTIRSPWSAEKAFDYMADLRNFEEWDPGVSSSKLVTGDEPGLGAEFDVPRRAVAEANSTLLRSYDVIEVTPTADGCEVLYDATLDLNGLLKLADPLLGLMFKRIGDNAAAGMEKALDGKKIS